MSDCKEAKAKGMSLWTIPPAPPKGIRIEVGWPPNKRHGRNLIRQQRSEINPCKRNVSALSPWIGSGWNHNNHEKEKQNKMHKRSLVIVRSLSWGEFWGIFSGNKTPNNSKGLPTPRWVERAQICLFPGQPRFPPPRAPATNERSLEEADNRPNSAAPSGIFLMVLSIWSFQLRNGPILHQGKKKSQKTYAYSLNITLVILKTL